MFERTTPIQTVTEITRSIKALLENGFSFVSIRGEVSNLRRPYSGHQYFTIKDNQAQIKAVLFKTQQRYLSEELQDGQQVICHGRLSIYEPRGEYQIIVDSIDFAGEGLLQVAFERLKEKLAGEGLFDPSRKRKLPFLPERIALITSPQGAALHDFLAIARQRFPAVPIEIYPVTVQGTDAPREITGALEQLNRRRSCDVAVICRGGGSIEDLWAFNDEDLARAVFHSTVPVVAAVGHEIDFTIIDFVADQRAPTPTAAAELVLPDRNTIREQVKRQQRTIINLLREQISRYRKQIQVQTRLLGNPGRRIDNFRLKLDHLQSTLVYSIGESINRRRQRTERNLSLLERQNPQQRIHDFQNRLMLLKQRIRQTVTGHLEQKKATLQKTTSLLNAVSPLAVLERGYSIVQRPPDNEIVRSTEQVGCGDRLTIQLHRGRLECEIITKTN